MEYNQFDLVHILSTKKVTYLNGPAGRPAKPQGAWSIVGFKGTNVILSKDDTVIMTDLTNITRVAAYDANRVFDGLKEINNRIIKRDENGQVEK